jgi:DNA mismatch repair ATPase MutS
MSKPKHSKFKNTGILFELLTRQITADILANKESSPAKNILFKYFSENKELGKEWQLYHFLLNEKAKSDTQAEKYIDIVVSKRLKLSNKELLEQKYNLIKEIKETYPIEDFLKSSIKNYKVNASICKLFEDAAATKNKYDVKEIVQSRSCITEHLCESKKEIKQSEDELVSFYKQQNEEIRLLSYKMLVDSLNEKYKNLDDNQKNILREYINNISNTNNLNDIVTKEFEKIKNTLNELKEKIDNNVVLIKINETIKQLNKIKPKTVKDNHIMAILLSYELIKEVKGQVV